VTEIVFGLLIGLIAFFTCFLWLIYAQDKQERRLGQQLGELRRELGRMKRGEEL
jgi:hypothetical protein